MIVVRRVGVVGVVGVCMITVRVIAMRAVPRFRVRLVLFLVRM